VDRTQVCYRCGYSLAGLASAQCPECSADVRPEVVAAAVRALEIRRRRWTHWALFAAILLLAGLGADDFVRNSPPWPGPLSFLLVTSGTGASGLFCARLLWRSMGAWAVLPGITLGLFLYFFTVVFARSSSPVRVSWRAGESGDRRRALTGVALKRKTSELALRRSLDRC
jgi:hypothetical protein